MLGEKLKKKLAEKGISMYQMAKELNIDVSTLYRKLKKNSFEIAEAQKIVSVLGLTAEEANDIFFNHKVA